MTTRPTCFILALILVSNLDTTAASCPAEFSLQNGLCVHLRSDGPKSTWCRAQASCQSIGGRLLSTVNTLIALQPVLVPLLSTDTYYIGFTDMLREAGTSRGGWLSTDDGELPVNNVTNAMWLTGKPGNSLSSHDCLILTSDGGNPLKLSDAYCSNSYGFICEPGSQSYNNAVSIFAKSDPPSPTLETEPFYCRGEEVTAKNNVHCVSLCAASPVCKAALFNRASLACRQILHGDAAVEAAIETDASWEKFVR